MLHFEYLFKQHITSFSVARKKVRVRFEILNIRFIPGSKYKNQQAASIFKWIETIIW